ncbi:hypothetical protein SS50377_23759 [Spironucleus salmonicida]|uniref:Uncharacterized protein n=1 Tax=Spironucleus salmonicida TaxID=348837 RepID=V6LQB6_9EUKA|nr:hypothetical protein SS50377_23759 [Spironucleus salmonicida]|eukprot:EST46438.1 Hypothetical protein SS50377_13523 [Spironucleus salmonicida]
MEGHLVNGLLAETTPGAIYKMTPNLLAIDEAVLFEITPDPEKIEFLLDPMQCEAVIRAKKISQGKFRVDFSIYEANELKQIIMMVKTAEIEQIVMCRLIDGEIKVAL